jgi:UDP-glucose 4-epimerase
MNKNVLVTGAAGYIGSHCVKELQRTGYKVVGVDNFVYGHRAAVPKDMPIYEVECSDINAITKILKEHAIDLVIHFAAYAYVGESVIEPLKYYRNNVGGTIGLLSAMEAAGVSKFVFSSSCATYGMPETQPIREDALQNPINPYGASKWMVERILADMAKAKKLSFVALRYFNASGAAMDGSLGEDHNPETHLIPDVLLSVLGKLPTLEVFGDDYPTPDGTCLRDYIHVEDLARAHVAAMSQLSDLGKALFLNLGTGRPHSVLEIIKASEEVIGQRIPYIITPRRPGDPAMLCADPSLAEKVLGWKAQHTDIKEIIVSAWKWHKTHPEGYAKQ